MDQDEQIGTSTQAGGGGGATSDLLSNQLFRNQLFRNQLFRNQLFRNSLTGTNDAIDLLTEQPLTSDTFEAKKVGDLGHQLHDPDAQAVMFYLTRCALPANAPPIEWDDPYDKGVHETFEGGAGACPEWLTGPPTEDCLEFVTGCLLSAVNAVGVANPYRGAGLTPANGPLQGTQPVPAAGFDRSGSEIASFVDCENGESGAARDCGWYQSESLVGVCDPGIRVNLNCNGNAWEVLRVCDGVRGCNHDDAERIHEDGKFCRSPKSTFTCPDTGRFTAMRGMKNGEASVEGVVTATNADYPADSWTVYHKREGAFYGNLFAGRNPDFTVYVDAGGNVVTDITAPPPGVPLQAYTDVYACHDSNWVWPDAAVHDRYCALVEDDQGEYAEGCAAESQGQCDPPGVGACGVDDHPAIIGDRDVGACNGGGSVWNYPLSTFLYDPCEAFEGQEHLCERLDD